MTRHIRGVFRRHGQYQHPAAPLAAYVNVVVGENDPPRSVDFMIDTGADFTTLAPRDTLRLLGRAYGNIDFGDPASSVESIGVGHAGARLIRISTQLQFTDDAGGHLTIEIPVAVAEPVPPQPGEHGNWLMPSLLGRDVLQYFDLRLSYHPPSAVLEEASASS